MQRLLPAMVLAVLATTGCGTFEVHMAGTLHRAPPEAAISFDPLGIPRLGHLSQRVHLPRDHEDERYGVVVVDSTPLPPGWRATHAPDGGILVSAVDRASPLAIAGLRAYDLIEAVNGTEVANVHSLVAVLKEAPQVEVHARRPNGEQIVIKANAVDTVQAASKFGIPFLIERTGSSTGQALGLGPLDGLFTYRQAVLMVKNPRAELEESTRMLRDLTRLHLETSQMTPQERQEKAAKLAELEANLAEIGSSYERRYVNRTEWGFLFNLFQYQGETDMTTGETRWQLRLLWFIPLGDDLVEAGV